MLTDRLGTGWRVIADPDRINFRRRSSAPRGRTVAVALSLLLSILLVAPASAQRKRRAQAAGGRVAVIVDERLAALREEPRLAGALVQRLGRGRVVALTGARRDSDGVKFNQVAVSRRTRGWLQSESFASPSRAGDDERLLTLVKASEGFDRIARARIFLDLFPRSPLRPQALLLHAEAAADAATSLTRTAAGRLAADSPPANGAPAHSYYLNFNGLDRFNRVGVRFVFDRGAKKFHYDGESWREILRRHPHSPEAARARQRLETLSAASAQR